MVRGLFRALVTMLVGLSLVPASGASGAEEAPAARGCADVFAALSLGPLPPEAATTPFFYASESAPPGNFNVYYSGFDCNQSDLNKLATTYSGIDGSATDPADYSLSDGSTGYLCGTPAVLPSVGDCPSTRSFSAGVKQDAAGEAALESFTVSLALPPGGNLTPPSTAPFFIVDDEPPLRVAFDDLSYDLSETHTTVTVPVWKAGLGATTVNYTVTPAPEAGAVEGQDVTVTSPRPLTFAANDVVETITLSINNDTEAEPTETFLLNLATPAPGAIEGSGTKAVSITDNEEGEFPSSRFHHPRHGWRYKKSDFRIRETHVFASDTGGSGVVGVQWALRRNRMNGSCQWLTDAGWAAKDCQNRQWRVMRFQLDYGDGVDLYIDHVTQLKSSVGTKIKNYTAYSRAIDGAGNVEKDFAVKRNANTFEIKRRRRT
jgi:hypothetical protein